MTVTDMMKVRWHWTKSFLELFWEKVEKGSRSECWLWKAGLNKDGYGKVKIFSKSWTAHRVSWMIHHGDIPHGLMVLHECDVANCVNPSHLFLGTNRDNMIDAREKGRLHPRHGSNHTNSKLTESRVRAIRRLAKTGKLSHGQISQRFGISRSVVSTVIRCDSWKHVT